MIEMDMGIDLVGHWIEPGSVDHLLLRDNRQVWSDHGVRPSAIETSRP